MSTFQFPFTSPLSAHAGATVGTAVGRPEASPWGTSSAWEPSSDRGRPGCRIHIHNGDELDPVSGSRFLEYFLSDALFQCS